MFPKHACTVTNNYILRSPMSLLFPVSSHPMRPWTHLLPMLRNCADRNCFVQSVSFPIREQVTDSQTVSCCWVGEEETSTRQPLGTMQPLQGCNHWGFQLTRIVWQEQWKDEEGDSEEPVGAGYQKLLWQGTGRCLFELVGLHVHVRSFH